MPIIFGRDRRSLDEQSEEINESGFLVLISGGYILLMTGDKLLKVI